MLPQSVDDDPVGERRQVDVSVGYRRRCKLRVIARSVAGDILLIVPQLPGDVIRVESPQNAGADDAFRITRGCIGRPQNPGPVRGAVRRDRQDRPALPGRPATAEQHLALRIHQVAAAVERNGTQRLILGPDVDELLRAAFVVRGLTMHVGAAPNATTCCTWLADGTYPPMASLFTRYRFPSLPPVRK